MSMVAEAPAPIAASGDSLREAFGKALSRLADEFPKLVVLNADIAGGTGVHHFRKSHPDRLLQFGIAEQNMMAAAGGLAAVGLLPVVTTFAVFCLRALEQARLSLAYARRNAKIVASHAGLDVGPDLLHAAGDVGVVLLADHLLRGEHLGVREAAGDVGLPQALVEADAGRVALDELAHRLREQGRPGLGFLVELVSAHQVSRAGVPQG